MPDVREYRGPYGGTWSEQEGFKPDGWGLPDIWDYILNQQRSALPGMPYASQEPEIIERYLEDPVVKFLKAPPAYTVPPYQPREESKETRFMPNWQQYVTSEKYALDWPGGHADIKATPPKPKEPKQKGQQPAAPAQPPQEQQFPPPGWSGQVQQPQGQGPIQPQGIQIPSTEQIEAEDRERALRYSSMFPGGAGMSPQKYYEEQLKLIQQQYPTQEELFSKAYAMDKRGRMRRIFDSILTQDPFYTDKLALQRATFDLHRQFGMATAMSEALKVRHDAENKQKAANAVTLERMLKDKPYLVKNKVFQRDFALGMGIPEEHVDKFIEDHYDEKTKTYRFILSPIEERRQNALREANYIQSLDPSIPNQIALGMVSDPSSFGEWLLDEEKKLNMQLGATKDPTERKIIEEKLKRHSYIKNLAARDQYYQKILNLIDQREFGWDRMSSQEKMTWGKNFKAAYEQFYGPDPEKTPEDLWLARENIRESIARSRSERRKEEFLIEQLKEKREAVAPVKDDLITATGDTHFRDKKSTEAYRLNAREVQKQYEDRARLGDTFEGKTPEVREARRYMDAYRDHIWSTIPAEGKKALGQLSHSEAVAIADAMELATLRGEAFSPMLMAHRILIRRGQIKPRK